MRELIDKAAVVAELDRIEYETNYEPFTEEVLGKRKVCKDIKDLLDKLKISDMDSYEKQGEQKEYTFKSLPRLLDMIEPTSKAKAYCQKLIDTLAKEGYNIDAKIVSDCLKQMNGEKVAMATMDEKKPIDNIEPKFEIEKGKWYVCNTSRYTDFVVGKAYYCPKNGMLKPNENAIARYVARDCFHLWSIDDAKDSDVLVTYDIRDNMKWIFLYRPNKHKLHINDPRFYCHYDLKSDSFKKDNDYVSVALGTKFRPATKEQCDLLFAKMKEAGWEWDETKKELKKIELKSFDYENANIQQNDFAPKVEPKFKSGDWVVCEVTGSVYQIKNCIESLSNHKYGYILTNGDYIGSDEVNHYHLWTIKDAKPGDVLASKNEDIILIFRNLDTNTSFSSYYNIAGKGQLGWSNSRFIPATKEQRDALEKAMADAGYRWNKEKLKLENIWKKYFYQKIMIPKILLGVKRKN